MAKGRDKHQAHQDALDALGRNLSRRARSRCELCGDREGLRPHEVLGGPEDPIEDWALLACARCRAAMDGELGDASTLRFLEETVWAELRPAQIAAVRVLRRVDQPWSIAALEGLYLDPEVEALLG
jgi:protein PhnA